MHLASTIIQATMAFMIASTTGAQATCNPKSLNTTTFNYYNDVENQTIHDIAVKFNRGVCDIGRANLSTSSHITTLYLSPLTMTNYSGRRVRCTLRWSDFHHSR